MSRFPELVIGWSVFWITYFVVGTKFPTHKAQTRPHAQITMNKVLAQLKNNILASMVVLPLVPYIPHLFSVPTILKFVLLPLISEVWFYYIHRLMHHRWFYSWHAMHHEFIQPHALAGLYCSVVEMLLVNQLSIAIPFQIMGFTLYELILANILVAINVLKGHSGLAKELGAQPWTKIFSSTEHDTHHKTLKYNFGILYLLDRVHGTYCDET